MAYTQLIAYKPLLGVSKKNKKPSMKKKEKKKYLLEKYSGFTIVCLTEEFSYSKEKHFVEFIRNKRLNGLDEILKKFKVKTFRRVINSISSTNLKKLEKVQRANARNKNQKLNSLSNYWKFDTRHLGEEIFKLHEELIKLSTIVNVYLELKTTDPTVDFNDDSLSYMQGYLNSSPEGIDAKWAWSIGIRGQNIGLIDIEQSWNLNHEDFISHNPTLIYGYNVGEEHGTAVLGEIIGVDNNRGIVGICPSIGYVKVASHFDEESESPGNVADAILAAVVHMNQGDVLLLEVQKGFLPTEVDEADRLAIQICTSLGIIVIEAAGNGNENLDDFNSNNWFQTIFSGKEKILNRNDEDFIDSGAIIVGASLSTVPHERHEDSNYGSRIDCYAWGENVTTTGYGDLAGGADEDINNDYTNTFSRTSSASPIIAGAAILIQSYYKSRFNRLLSPSEMREILSNPNNGTAQGESVNGNIGIMPDLKKILIKQKWLEPFMNIVFEEETNNNWLEPFLNINLP